MSAPLTNGSASAPPGNRSAARTPSGIGVAVGTRAGVAATVAWAATVGGAPTELLDAATISSGGAGNTTVRKTWTVSAVTIDTAGLAASAMYSDLRSGLIASATGRPPTGTVDRTLVAPGSSTHTSPSA